MVTRSQLLDAKGYAQVHFTFNGPCTRLIGPRGGVKINVIAARQSGMVKTWKRDTERFLMPVRRGLYDNGYIDQDNAEYWHLADDCPLNT